MHQSLPRPLACNFDDAGITDALERLAQSLPAAAALPRWLWRSDAASAAFELQTASTSDVTALVGALGALRVFDGIDSALPFAPSLLALTDPPARARWTERTAYTAVATLRVRAGAALEYAALDRWNCFASASLRSIDPNPSVRLRQRTRRIPLNADAALMFESYAAALWTSCHAEYVACATDDASKPLAPSLLLVASHATELRLTNLLDAQCFASNCSRNAHPMQQLLARCVNPASRGWHACLEELLRKHEGSRRVVVDAVVVALTGLHPCLLPPNRSSWRKRLVAGRVAVDALLGEAGSALLVRHSDLVKEAMRRLLSGLLVDSLALRNVALRVGAPVGRLVAPPLDTPARGMLNSAAQFVRAACAMVDANGAGSATDRLSAALSSESCNDATNDGDGRPGTWIGRSKQRTPAPRLLHRAEECFAAAFRAQFLPFWMRATSCGARPGRLDRSQHEALHSQNAALVACLAVDKHEALRIHRLVLANPAAPLITVDNACRAIGVDNEGDVPLHETQPATLARLLLYGRMAWVCDRVLVVDLGRRARTMHLAAIAWRHLDHVLPTEEELADGAVALQRRVNALPTHITHLCVCTECM